MKATIKTLLCCVSVLAIWLPLSALAELRVGAARIDVTPAVDQLPESYRGVNDRIYARAIVVDNDGTRAALITLDVGGIPTPLWQSVSERLARELSIAPEHMLLTATHTHSVPRQQAPDYVDKVVESVRTAISKLQPARMAWGTGLSWLNINRNMVDPQTGRWREGPNYEGPSDKTVAVLAFETPAGDPIAVYYNYAVHGVIGGQLDEVSGDIPGASSRYIEESLGDDVVALWSLGAAGDQNPIFFQQTYDLRKIRIAAYARRGEDISNSMPPGGTGLDRNNPEVMRLMNQQRQLLLSMGQMLGEEVLHVLNEGLEPPRTDATIAGVQKTITCPGRQRTDQGREGTPGTYVDGEPVKLLLSLLQLGDVYLGGVNAEIFNPIAQRFKAEAPYKHSMMVTLTNGTANSGYVPHDAAFGFNTFEVLSSRLQPGCAEKSIVNGLLDLMNMTGANHP
jgi:neutral ceramidase